VGEKSRYKKRLIGKRSNKRLTVEKIFEYIKEYSELFEVEFCVKEITIPTVRLPELNDKIMNNIFECCLGKGESKHHGYLKWFSYNYIIKNNYDIIDSDIGFETQIYLPNIMAYEISSDICGRFLKKGENLYLQSRSYIDNQPLFWIQEADVSCKNCLIIECGVTSTMSITMPIITEVVPQIIWIPYPEYSKKNNDWADFENPIKAFIIS